MMGTTRRAQEHRIPSAGGRQWRAPVRDVTTLIKIVISDHHHHSFQPRLSTRQSTHSVLISRCTMLSNSNTYSYYEHEQEREHEQSAPLLANDSSNTFALDLSHLAQSLDEKLPAIIITPCMPSSPLDYKIAFLASSNGKDQYDGTYPWAFFHHPTTAFLNLRHYSTRRARATFCLALLMILIGIHLLISRIMSCRDGEGPNAWPAPFWR